MASASRPRPAVLCVLDGWGHRPDPRYNAILDARTPNYDRLIATCPQGLIDASETFVGLPKGQMGNSEVGHMNLGAGRVAVPDLPRIDTAIADGSLAKALGASRAYYLAAKVNLSDSLGPVTYYIWVKGHKPAPRAPTAKNKKS